MERQCLQGTKCPPNFDFWKGNENGTHRIPQFGTHRYRMWLWVKTKHQDGLLFTSPIHALAMISATPGFTLEGGVASLQPKGKGALMEKPPGHTWPAGGHLNDGVRVGHSCLLRMFDLQIWSNLNDWIWLDMAGQSWTPNMAKYVVTFFKYVWLIWPGTVSNNIYLYIWVWYGFDCSCGLLFVHRIVIMFLI